MHGQGLVPWGSIERLAVNGRDVLLVATADAAPFTDVDLANRLNARIRSSPQYIPGRTPDAGPGFREIGPRHLHYPASTGVHRLVDDAEGHGVVVERIGTAG